MFYLAVLPTFLLFVCSGAEDIFREDPLGKGISCDFRNSGSWYCRLSRDLFVVVLVGITKVLSPENTSRNS
jgi:hypothetical protein